VRRFASAQSCSDSWSYQNIRNRRHIDSSANNPKISEYALVPKQFLQLGE